MKFLIDAQLPPALSRWLAERGHEASHVADRGMTGASDAAIASAAETDGAILVTKDEDFADMVATGGKSPVVVWVRVGNTRRAELLTWFDPLIDDIVRMIGDGQVLIELR